MLFFYRFQLNRRWRVHTWPNAIEIVKLIRETDSSYRNSYTWFSAPLMSYTYEIANDVRWLIDRCSLPSCFFFEKTPISIQLWNECTYFILPVSTFLGRNQKSWYVCLFFQKNQRTNRKKTTKHRLITEISVVFSPKRTLVAIAKHMRGKLVCNCNEM